MFFFQGSNYSDSLVYGNVALGEIKGHSSTTTPINKFFLLWKFQVCVYLRQTPVKYFPLQDTNYSDSFVFWNTGLEEMKGHIRYMSIIRENIFFSSASEIFFSLQLKLLRFSGFQEYRSGRGQRSHFSNDAYSKKISTMKVLDMCLTYMKRNLQPHQLNVFFFWA